MSITLTDIAILLKRRCIKFIRNMKKQSTGKYESISQGKSILFLLQSVIIRKMKDNEHRSGRKRASECCSQRCKLAQPLQKIFNEYYTCKKKCPLKRRLHSHVHGSIISNSHERETNLLEFHLESVILSTTLLQQKGKYNCRFGDCWEIQLFYNLSMTLKLTTSNIE